MDAAGTVAGWLSFLATAVGLGSLLAQTNAISERLDPYHSSRNREHLGRWLGRQPRGSTMQLMKPPPIGPKISARLVGGFCGRNLIGVSRLPSEETGKASWTAILAIFHEIEPAIGELYSMKEVKRANTVVQYESMNYNMKLTANRSFPPDIDGPERRTTWAQEPWNGLEIQQLKRHGGTTCMPISRNSLITMLTMCNARQAFKYSDASGHRAAYSSYCGHWYLSWPLGGSAVVNFHPHDSHSRITDTYPWMFQVRVDKCAQMLCGIVSSPDFGFQCAFPGRKPAGLYTLEYQRKGFPGAHGGRHLYNQQGGKVYEVDFLFARQMSQDAQTPPDSAILTVHPALGGQGTCNYILGPTERKVIEQALDCLPWSSLSWSMHRGLRDILKAFGKGTMDAYREHFANKLRRAVAEHGHQLEAKGWESIFVKQHMADLAANCVMAGGGYSGDTVRVVTDVALLLLPANVSFGELDETEFWRESRHIDQTAGGERQPSVDDVLPMDACVALTKFVVLEWSVELDYQMYHDLPPELLFK